MIHSGSVRLVNSDVTNCSDVGVAAYRTTLAPSSVEVENCTVSGNRYVGVVAYDSGTTVSLAETTIQGTLPDQFGDYGMGIDAALGATVTAARCTLVSNRQAGIRAVNSGTQVTLEDSLISSTTPRSNGVGGYGIDTQCGASVIASGCTIDRNTAIGLLAREPGTELTATDTIVRSTQPAETGEAGPGAHWWIPAFGTHSLAAACCWASASR